MKRFFMLLALLLTVGMVFYACGGSDDAAVFYGPAPTGTFYFQATDGYTGSELYKTNGTAAGTAIVNNINVEGTLGIEDSWPYLITESGGTTYFSADDGVNSRLFIVNASGKAELVTRADGTTTIDNPTELTDVGGTLYYREGTTLGMVNALTFWKSGFSRWQRSSK